MDFKKLMAKARESAAQPNPDLLWDVADGYRCSRGCMLSVRAPLSNSEYADFANEDYSLEDETVFLDEARVLVEFTYPFDRPHKIEVRRPLMGEGADPPRPRAASGELLPWNRASLSLSIALQYQKMYREEAADD